MRVLVIVFELFVLDSRLKLGTPHKVRVTIKRNKKNLLNFFFREVTLTFSSLIVDLQKTYRYIKSLWVVFSAFPI